MSEERAMLAGIIAARGAVRRALEEVTTARAKLQTTKEWATLEFAKEGLKKARELLDCTEGDVERFLQPELELPASQPTASGTNGGFAPQSSTGFAGAVNEMLHGMARQWNEGVEECQAEKRAINAAGNGAS